MAKTSEKSQFEIHGLCTSSTGQGSAEALPCKKTVISSNKHNERKVNYPILISVCIAGIAAIAETGR